MRIYLVRHGQSVANIDPTVHRETPDHAIGLSPEGVEQARKAGEFLRMRRMERLGLTPYEMNKQCANVRLWMSPYLRARETAHEIVNRNRYIGTVREHVLLCEQQFGLFDGVPDEELPRLYPAEHAHYAKCEAFEGRFWARMPLGESRFDVAQRVHQAFGTFHRDAERHGIDDLIIVAHGVTIRAFVMMWCHKSVDWFESEPNPANCSIRMIVDGEDHGYIFEGFR